MTSQKRVQISEVSGVEPPKQGKLIYIFKQGKLIYI